MTGIGLAPRKKECLVFSESGNKAIQTGICCKGYPLPEFQALMDRAGKENLSVKGG